MGRLPRFPYGGTNRIRFKGYNLSRMAPPSKMLKFCLLCFFAHCITALHKCKGKSIFQKTKQFFHFPVRRDFLLHSVRGLRLFPKQSISSSKFRSGIEVFSRTECPFKGSWFGFGGGFPNGVSSCQGFVRELVAFPEQNVHSKVVGSGFEVIFRTKYLLLKVSFGNWWLFPNGMSIQK